MIHQAPLSQRLTQQPEGLTHQLNKTCLSLWRSSETHKTQSAMNNRACQAQIVSKNNSSEQGGKSKTGLTSFQAVKEQEPFKVRD